MDRVDVHHEHFELLQAPLRDLAELFRRRFHKVPRHRARRDAEGPRRLTHRLLEFRT